jgi:predicted Fe-S protein YdhL (DUF1289 family)
MAKFDRAKEATFAQMGLAALIPGVQYAVEQVQAILDNLRAELAALQEGGTALYEPAKPKRGQPAKTESGRMSMAGLKPGTAEYRAVGAHNKRLEREAKSTNSQRAQGARNAWSGMTPEERSAEMKRRIAVTRGKAPSRRQGKPAGWKGGTGKSPAQTRWERLSKRRRKELLAKMAAAREAKRAAANPVNGAAA